jgi:hypothetical protein
MFVGRQQGELYQSRRTPILGAAVRLNASIPVARSELPVSFPRRLRYH